MRALPELIQKATLLEDNINNYYSKDGEKFAYFMNHLLIDGDMHNIRIAVKKKINSNHFYIHHIDTEKVLNCSAHLKRQIITRLRTFN